MQIADKKVAQFHFSLKNDQGEILDSSKGETPLGYIHGQNNLMPGLEKALAGHKKGDKFSVKLDPEDAFGSYAEELIKEVPLNEFENPKELKPGTKMQVHSQQGDQIVTVLDIVGETVRVDFNHPFAGQTLQFDIEVLEVRDATADELSHGHLHGDGGCCH
ncbi:MAG: peptidylprolyl isomerase [Candidatus Omnitrophica bacterium]|nr:peptidylprolyl isomerase [Candidatus Omnitrophota bacterium]